MKKGFRKKISAAAVLSLLLAVFCAPASSFAYWQNEQAGPGVAVWIDDAEPAEALTELLENQNENSAGAGVYSGNQAVETDESDQAAVDSKPTGEVQENPDLVMSGGRQLDLTKPMIALTYDDGPLAKVGNRIMDVLEQYGGRATFFMVGERVPAFASEVQRMAANGHEVANHTQNHKYLNKLGAADIAAQVEQCNNVIQSVCGVRPALMRLPGGSKNSTVLANVNMPIILWNIDTKDWATRNSAKTIEAVLGKVQDGDIVLMHELYASTADATESLVPQLTAQGFQLVTVSELARFKGKELTANNVYFSMR